MEAVIGKIAGIEGVFYIRGLDGSLRKALENNAVYEGEVVIGDANNNPSENVTVSIADGSEIVLLGKEKQLFDSSLLNREFSNEDTVTNKDSIQALLEKNGDIDNIEDLETAAGEEEIVDSTDGVDSVFLDSNGAITDVNADLRDVAFTEETTESRDDNYLLNIDTTPAPATATADPSVTAVNDAATITITSTNSFTEDSGNAVGDVVSTFSTNDEDGDTVTVTIDDTTNYAISGNTVVLTQAGLDLVNSGADLPAFTLSATDGIQNTPATATADPSVTAVNDAATITITSTNSFTEDSGNAVGDVVSTFSTNDEDGDTVTVTIDDTTNYAISGNTVVLTQAGLDLVNSGADLPAFTLSATDGIQNTPATATADPSVTAVNDAATITITSTNSFTEDSGNAVGDVVSTFSTNDEDGDTVTVTIDDTTNYAISGNTVVLTQAGLDLVNSGADLPAFTLSATDGIQNTPATATADPSVTAVNDAATITITSTNSFTEDSGNAVGDVVSTFSTNDEDGDTVTVTIDDTTNYAISGNTVVLTQAGLDLVNSGADLPAFTLSATDGIQNTPATATADPSVTAVNDAATITITSTNSFTEDSGNAVGDVVSTFSTNDEDGDTVTVTIDDTTNYAISGNTVVLTQAGLDLVNSGADLPAFTLSATDGIQNTPATATADPSVTAVNDAATITITSTNSFTEDSGNAVGDVVSTFSTNDEDGDTVTVTIDDTTNYAISGNTVVLTQAGLDLVNSGADLPAFTLSATDGIQNTPATATADPSVTAVNDAATITITSTNSFTEDSGNAVGDVVSTFSTNDEDGDTVTVTIDDTTNYAISGNTVVLTQAGLDLVNSGADLPAFTLSATDGIQNTPATATADPSVTAVNDAATITITSTNSFTEDSGNAVGDVVSTFSTNDEDGDTVTVTIDDTTNYAISGNTVVLTQAGLDLVNSGADLPAFTLSATDGIQNTPATATADPSVTAVNDAATITITSTNSFTEDSGNAVGDVVSTFSTNDEDGDTVTVTIDDTTNYAISGNTVVLTQAGLDLVNSGADLPAFTLSATDGIQNTPATATADPSVTAVNDAATITITSTNSFTEDSGNAVGDVVSTFSTNDEDGDTVTVTIDDTTNYAISGNTVVLTQAGLDLVNSGADLPAFTLSATDGIQNTPATATADPSVTAVNDAATITITSTNSFTEDSGNAVGDVVSTFSTNDEDGDTVTVTIDDTTNYAISGNTVVLTQAGLDLVNSGADLPAFTLSATDGIQNTPATATADPSVTAVNDAATITITSTNSFTEDSGNAVGDVVSTFSTNDEDGDTVTVTIDDTTNYAISGNTVVLTQAGLDLVNSGADLPAFTLSATDGIQNTPATATADPSVTAVNDAATITITSTNSFTEDSGNAVGDVVSTFSTNDEDGDTVTVTIDDTTNYAISGNTVVLTQAGLDLVNSGADLPAFTLSATDGIQNTPATATADPSVTAVNDATVVINDSVITNEDTAINIDVLVNDIDSDSPKSPVYSVTQGANGIVSINTDGTIKYTPNENFNGEDSFTYTNVEGSTATVNVEVTAVADAPLLNLVSDVIVSQTIGIDNVADTNDGFTVTALDVNGEVTTVSIHTAYPEGFGVTGAASGADSELGGSEKLVVTLDNPVSSVDVSFAWMNSSESASYTFYKDGVEVGTGLTQFGSDGIEIAETLKPSNGSEFDTIIFSAPYSGDDYLINSITYDKVESTSGAVTVEEGDFVALNISSSLVDIDGSESLDIVLNDIPAGFVVSDGTNSFTADDSSSSVNITNWSLSTLVLTTPNVNATTTYTLNIVATSIEASNGDSASTVLPFEVTVNNNADLMILNDDIAQVDEAALTTGTNSISDAEVVSGNLLSDDTLPAGAQFSSVSIAGGTTAVDTDTITVTTAEGNELVVDIATGDYTYTLVNPVDHSVLENAADIFTYTVTDSLGTVQSANLTVTIANDAPVVNNTTSIMVSSPDTVDTNIVFALDVSGSMDEIVTGTTTRFDIAKQALIDTIDAYSKQGDVNVNLTLFNGGAVSLGWKNETEIVDYLSKLSMNHSSNTVLYDGSTIEGLTSVYTNYEAALEITPSTYDTGLPAADNTVAYFISDGAPTVENNEGNDRWFNVGTDSESGWLDSAYVTDWTNFIDSNNIDLNVIGIGDNLSTYYLDLVQVQDGKTAIVVTDATQLSDTIISNIQIVEGTLYDLDGSAGINFGADGGYISELTYNGILYTYDSADPKQEITLSEGVMELDFETGNYIYTPTVTSGDFVSEEFNITVVDNDGDSHTDSLNLNIINDTITFEPTSDIDAGGGYDILLVESSVDFSLITNEVKNIEEINLGDGAQDITLSLSDVLSITDADNDLYITGDGDIGDSVSLDTADGWSKSASQSQVGFNEYSSTEDPTVKLQIQDDLEVKLS